MEDGTKLVKFFYYEQALGTTCHMVVRSCDSNEEKKSKCNKEETKCQLFFKYFIMLCPFFKDGNESMNLTLKFLKSNQPIGLQTQVVNKWYVQCSVLPRYIMVTMAEW